MVVREPEHRDPAGWRGCSPSQPRVLPDHHRSPGWAGPAPTQSAGGLPAVAQWQGTASQDSQPPGLSSTFPRDGHVMKQWTFHKCWMGKCTSQHGEVWKGQWDRWWLSVKLCSLLQQEFRTFHQLGDLSKPQFLHLSSRLKPVYPVYLTRLRGGSKEIMCGSLWAQHRPQALGSIIVLWRAGAYGVMSQESTWVLTSGLCVPGNLYFSWEGKMIWPSKAASGRSGPGALWGLWGRTLEARGCANCLSLLDILPTPAVSKGQRLDSLSK